MVLASGNVEAVFDDGGGDEDVVLVMHEGEHDFFEVVLAHLAVADDDAGGGDELLDLCGDFVDGLDAVVDEVDLAAALELDFDGGADELLVELGDDGLDGHAIAGRRFDHAHVAQADERHVQRARDGRGGHGEDVDFAAHLLEAFFVADAEALLFVDDEEAEVVELDVFREQAVRADEDVDAAVLDLLEDELLLFGRAEAGDHFDVDGELAEAAFEGLEMLEARTVVGVRTATWRPSCTALKAARMATSVLP